MNTDMPEPSNETVVAVELREELERLVHIASGRPRITVREGMPGCGWSFSWDNDVVTVDSGDLRTLSPDLCRGITLHEASHAAITVLHRLLPEAALRRLMPLLNTVEDLRIDAWQRRRFPGSSAWLDASNNAIRATVRERALPRSRQVQFLLGMLERGYFGEVTHGTLPEVVGSLDACRSAIARAVACQPPGADDPALVLASQRSMWEIVRDGILPTWQRLVELDRSEGISSLARRELEALMECIGGASPCRGNRSGARRGTVQRRLPQPGHADRHAHRKDGPSVAYTNGANRYEAAWKRVAPVADRLGNELLRVLVPRRRMRWSAGHPTGPRLETRRAMQFEADPRHYSELWSRPILPHRREPAVMLLVDRSSSMKSNRLIDRALEGTALLTEVCHRVGVPAAVWSFAHSTTAEVGWDTRLDDDARARLGCIPERCEGATEMAAALAIVSRDFSSRHANPKILFMISDGAPDRERETINAVRRLETQGITAIGLGLGDETAGLAKFFRLSVTGIAPERLVDHVGELLGEVLLAEG